MLDWFRSLLFVPLDILRRLSYCFLPRHVPVPKELIECDARDRRYQRQFINSRGEILHVYRWLAGGPLSRKDSSQLKKVRAIVFLIHGYNDSLVTYQHVAEYLNEQAFDVYGMDHQGNGLSGGDRVQIKNFDDVIEDYERFINHTKKNLPSEHSSLPTFLIGHSMGGLLAVHIAHRNPKGYRAVILSAPALMLKPVAPAVVAVGRVLRKVFPKLPIESLDPQELSSDPMVLQRAMREVVLSKKGVSCCTGLEIMRGVTMANSIREKFSVPFLIVHGSDDLICPLAGSNTFVNNTCQLSEREKKLIIYPGVKHVTFQDANWEKILLDISNWIKERL